MSTSTSDIKCEILSEEQSKFDLCFKLIVVGDCNVGKSSLIIKAIKNYFEELYSPTVGFEFLSFHIKISDQNIKLQIWDTCGQEVYRSLINSFYRNSSLAILVYSIDNKNSFKHLEEWLNDIKSQANPDIKIFLIGNKADLEDNRVISKDEGEKFCSDHQLSLFLETSAKTGFNAQNLFMKAGIVLYQEHLKNNNVISRTGSVLERPSYIPPLSDQKEEEAEEKPRKKGCQC